MRCFHSICRYRRSECPAHETQSAPTRTQTALKSTCASAPLRVSAEIGMCVFLATFLSNRRRCDAARMRCARDIAGRSYPPPPFHPGEGGVETRSSKRMPRKVLMRLGVGCGRRMGRVREGGGRSRYPALGCPTEIGSNSAPRPSSPPGILSQVFITALPLAQARGVTRSNRSGRTDLT